MEKKGRIFETLEAMKPTEINVSKARLFTARHSRTKEEFELFKVMLGLNMICKPCREAADSGKQELHCSNNETRCDCQHKSVRVNNEAAKEN